MFIPISYCREQTSNLCGINEIVETLLDFKYIIKNFQEESYQISMESKKIHCVISLIHKPKFALQMNFTNITRINFVSLSTF